MNRSAFLGNVLNLILGFLTVLSSAVCASDDSQPLPLNQVPKAVKDAVMKKFPDAKPQSATQGTEDSKPYIDVVILVKSQKIWVTCDPDGTIRVIDREITLKDLPAPVAVALHKKYPKAAIRLVNEIIEGSAPSYDIALTFNRKKLIATFDATGEFVEELDDDDN